MIRLWRATQARAGVVAGVAARTTTTAAVVTATTYYLLLPITCYLLPVAYSYHFVFFLFYYCSYYEQASWQAWLLDLLLLLLPST
jgi:hypothetical protein